jgi:hypothetical protein
VRRAPGFPCALCFLGQWTETRLGRSRRENAAAWLNCSNVIACDKREAFAQGSACDEAIQTLPAARWIASLALAMMVLQSDWLFEKLNSLQL